MSLLVTEEEPGEEGSGRRQSVSSELLCVLMTVGAMMGSSPYVSHLISDQNHLLISGQAHYCS